MKTLKNIIVVIFTLAMCGASLAGMFIGGYKLGKMDEKKVQFKRVEAADSQRIKCEMDLAAARTSEPPTAAPGVPEPLQSAAPTPVAARPAASAAVTSQPVISPAQAAPVNPSARLLEAPSPAEMAQSPKALPPGVPSEPRSLPRLYQLQRVVSAQASVEGSLTQSDPNLALIGQNQASPNPLAAAPTDAEQATASAQGASQSSDSSGMAPAPQTTTGSNQQNASLPPVQAPVTAVTPEPKQPTVTLDEMIEPIEPKPPVPAPAE
jgi:hypothetical protein